MGMNTTINRYLEKLSKTNSVLILVDYLTGFDTGLRTINRSTYVNNVEAVSKMGAIFKLPTFILGDEGGFRGNFYPFIKKHLPEALQFGRHTPSAFHVPEFVEALANTGRKKVIISGISIDNCVLQTTLDLLKADYDVYVIVDASGADEPLVETSAMMRLTQAGAVMVTWVSIASEIMDDWNTPEGAAIGKLYQDHSAWGGFLK